MTSLSGANVIVVGAGVFGLGTAAELGAAGARCTVLDAAPFGDNASAIAAGMLAPALESVCDPETAGRFALLAEARDRWPDFARRHDLPAPDRSGALWLGSPPEADALAGTLERAGAGFERLSEQESRARCGCAASGAALFTPEDWRIDAAEALRALRAAVERRGGRLMSGEVLQVDAGSAATEEGSLAADAVVLCTGPGGGRLVEAVPELACIHPIKGEILLFDGAAPFTGPTVRTADGYVVPGARGAMAGATMEPGVDDRAASPRAAARLRAMAAALFPHLADARAEHRAGVRAATPDGLPLVGRSASGVWLATGARRNGWLLAPLAAETLAAALSGEPARETARAFDPGRFRAYSSRNVTGTRTVPPSTGRPSSV